MWGRVRGRSLPAPPEDEVHWDGDRVTWLQALTRDLRRRRVDVAMGREVDAFDLRLRAGPFLTAKVRTAVAWRWEPRASVRYRATPLLWAVLLTTIAVGVLGSGWLAAAALLATACTLLAAGVEMFKLRGGVRRALARTTLASRA
jgi:hypothetical protein